MEISERISAPYSPVALGGLSRVVGLGHVAKISFCLAGTWLAIDGALELVWQHFGALVPPPAAAFAAATSSGLFAGSRPGRIIGTVLRRRRGNRFHQRSKGAACTTSLLFVRCR